MWFNVLICNLSFIMLLLNRLESMLCNCDRDIKNCVIIIIILKNAMIKRKQTLCTHIQFTYLKARRFSVSQLRL